MNKTLIICAFLAAAMSGNVPDTDPHREAAEAWGASADAWEALANVLEEESPDSFDVSHAVRAAERAAREARDAHRAYTYKNTMTD